MGTIQFVQAPSGELRPTHIWERGSARGVRRAFVVVLDACGVGALPDAADYGDAGTNTLGHLARRARRPRRCPRWARWAGRRSPR